MYESFYNLTAKPFQLKPDPDFFFGSKGHKRAMSYLEYGLGQGEGFIVITGEIGAGKTTLMRSLFRKLENKNIIAAQIVNTHLDASDTLRMVVSAFGLPHGDVNKADLLIRLEQFLRQCDKQGKRTLLVVDEAQNLTPHTVEELRMLSNFQTSEKSLLQIFLLGQPEFRKTLMRNDMQQLQQRVIATYHLGPLDALETREYIEHRLLTVGWKGDPNLSVEAFFEIFNFTGGIPRKINSLCDRLFLLGYLEERHMFRSADVQEVIKDIRNEFVVPAAEPEQADTRKATMGENKITHPSQTENKIAQTSQMENKIDRRAGSRDLDDKIHTMERSVVSVLDMFKQILTRPNVPANGPETAKDREK